MSHNPRCFVSRVAVRPKAGERTMMATRSAMRNIDPSDSIIVRRGGAAQTNYDIRYYIHRFSTRTVLFWYYNYEALGIRIPMHQVRYLRHFDLDLYDYCCGSKIGKLVNW